MRILSSHRGVVGDVEEVAVIEAHSRGTVMTVFTAPNRHQLARIA